MWFYRSLYGDLTLKCQDSRQRNRKFAKLRKPYPSLFINFNLLLIPSTVPVVVLNSTRLSPTPLVFKTVHETFTSHGSSMIRCLSYIPHYPFILDFFKSFGGLRLGTITTGFSAVAAITGSLCVVAMSV